MWGQPVLAVESFTDPSRHTGSCYAAAGFTPVGPSAGYARNRGTKIRHGQPKVYWLRPVHRHGLGALSAAFDSPLTHPRQGRPPVDMNTLDINGPAGLLSVLGQVPEHRKARGIRHDLAALLALATAAVLSGADSTAAIAQYARTLTQPALASLGIRRNTRTRTYVAPAYQTLRRAIRSVNAHALDATVTGWLHTQLSTGRLSPGQLTQLIIALDGKTVRGAKDTTGNQLHLFAALVHGEATVIAQHPVDSKTNEISGFIPLLDQIAERHHTEPDQLNDNHPDDPDHPDHRDHDGDGDGNSDSDDADSASEVDAPSGGPGKLHGVIVTADALHTQRAHARYLRKHGGDYVLIAKGNQPTLFAALDALPPTTIKIGHTEQDTGHGRRDRRVLKVIDLTDPAHAPPPGPLPRRAPGFPDRALPALSRRHRDRRRHSRDHQPHPPPGLAHRPRRGHPRPLAHRGPPPHPRRHLQRRRLHNPRRSRRPRHGDHPQPRHQPAPPSRLPQHRRRTPRRSLGPQPTHTQHPRTMTRNTSCEPRHK